MPVGAYGGKREIMEFVSPAGPVYQAGTLSGNPIAMAAGLTMLNHLNTDPTVYDELTHIGSRLAEGIKSINQGLGLNYTVNSFGSMYSLINQCLILKVLRLLTRLYLGNISKPC